MTAAVNVAVRLASPDDVDAMSAAHRAGQAAVADARGGPIDTLLKGRQEPIEATFASDLDTDGVLLWTGTADDIFVGYCVLSLSTLPNGDELGTVTDLWVHPKSRGIGVGYALMRTATDEASARGCIGIDARALPGDRSTKNFFESFGLVARAIEVHKPLTPIAR